MKSLKLAKYLSAVPAPPKKVYWEYKVPADLWGMFSNDTIGDCTCACIAHMIMLATAHTGKMVTPTVAEVVAAYSAITGYVPGNESTDNGANISDVLNYWQNTGIAGHKITAWAQVDQTNIQEVKQAIWLFGGVDIGIEVFQSMEDQFDAREPWDNPSGDDLGGHSIPLFGYGSEGTTGVTWAALQQMGWPCFSKICSEAYAVITPDWINQLSGKTYSGFDLAQLQADLAAL
jgi:hypothetical protein